jgi:hypothetical protein
MDARHQIVTPSISIIALDSGGPTRQCGDFLFPQVWTLPDARARELGVIPVSATHSCLRRRISRTRRIDTLSAGIGPPLVVVATSRAPSTAQRSSACHPFTGVADFKIQHVSPAGGAVDVTRAQGTPLQIAELVEHEQRVQPRLLMQHAMGLIETARASRSTNRYDADWDYEGVAHAADRAEMAAEDPHRRFIKTHLPLDALVYSPKGNTKSC